MLSAAVLVLVLVLVLSAAVIVIDFPYHTMAMPPIRDLTDCSVSQDDHHGTRHPTSFSITMTPMKKKQNPKLTGH